MAEKHVVISESVQAEHLEMYCSFKNKKKVKTGYTITRLVSEAHSLVKTAFTVTHLTCSYDVRK